MANAFPASPAWAAVMDAFRDSRVVSSEMFLIYSTILWMLCEDSSNFRLVSWVVCRASVKSRSIRYVSSMVSLFSVIFFKTVSAFSSTSWMCPFMVSLFWLTCWSFSSTNVACSKFSTEQFAIFWLLSTRVEKASLFCLAIQRRCSVSKPMFSNISLISAMACPCSPSGPACAGDCCGFGCGFEKIFLNK